MQFKIYGAITPKGTYIPEFESQIQRSDDKSLQVSYFNHFHHIFKLKTLTLIMQYY